MDRSSFGNLDQYDLSIGASARNAPKPAGLSFAQQLYASAGPNRYTSSVKATEASESVQNDGIPTPAPTPPADVPAPARSLPHLPQPNLTSLNLTSPTNISVSSSPSSLYNSVVRPGGPRKARVPSYDAPEPHRAQTVMLTPPSSPPVPEMHQPHRASTLASTGYSQPSKFETVPSFTTVLRPPVQSSVSHHMAHNSSGMSVSLPAPLDSAPPPPPKPSVSYPSSPAGQSSFGQSYPSPPSQVTSPAFSPVNPAASYPSPPASYSSPNSGTGTYFSNHPSPSFASPGFQQSPVPSPPANTGPSTNDVLKQMGKTMGKYALKKVAGAAVQGLTMNIVSSDIFDNISAMFTGLNINNLGIDTLQLQAVLQGLPGADYQGVINALLAQQKQHQQQAQQNQNQMPLGQNQPNYQALIAELQKLQQAAAAQSAAATTQFMTAAVPSAQQIQQDVQNQMNAAMQQGMAQANLMNAQLQHAQAMASAMQQQTTQNVMNGLAAAQQSYPTNNLGNQAVLGNQQHLQQLQQYPMAQTMANPSVGYHPTGQLQQHHGFQNQNVQHPGFQNQNVQHQNVQQNQQNTHQPPSTTSQFLTAINGALKLGNEVAHMVNDSNGNDNNGGNNAGGGGGDASGGNGFSLTDFTQNLNFGNTGADAGSFNFTDTTTWTDSSGTYTSTDNITYA
ncbi:hypothetical protein C8J56DRAFT_537130 [Mycena floridula]|nr:hypothetical protein C8J56DRAFT_537130 [Mycena floridula]